MRLLVGVLPASIMHPDNAAASFYQQLTGIPAHTEEDSESQRRRDRGKEGRGQECMHLQNWKKKGEKGKLEPCDHGTMKLQLSRE